MAGRERVEAHVGTLLWPALLAEPLSEVASEVAEQSNSPGRKELIQTHLEAMAGRVMQRGGWSGGPLSAGAEPILTGRNRPYDESTLRKSARELVELGATDAMACVVEKGVEQAVEQSGAKAVAFTDMYDQVYWTKRPAHAAPIGNRGNRLLAATYFGMTFVQPENGLPLAYHVSWHKPASPLQDGLEALHATSRRAAWLTANIDLHIWDRGGSGAPTLRWALQKKIPYLTVSNGSTSWTRQRRSPQVYTPSKVPVFVKRDVRVAKGSPPGSQPQEVIFPAHSKKGRASSKALRYRTGAPLSNARLRRLDEVYKQRWPGNENGIKALVGAHFDRNLDRTLTPTNSRGTDGRKARLELREQRFHEKVKALAPTDIPQLSRNARPLAREKCAIEEERAKIDAIPVDKGARMPTGPELLCKNLMLLMYNVLALLLMDSHLAAVRALTPLRVQELLLNRRFLAGIDQQGITLWVDAMDAPAERVLQEELIRLINKRALLMNGRRLRMRIRDPAAKKAQLRFSA